MAYDISDDELPDAVIVGLKTRGWKWDASAQEWRLHNEQGPFSPIKGDHVRQFDIDVSAAVEDAVTPGNLDRADNMSSNQVQNNDTMAEQIDETAQQDDPKYVGPTEYVSD